MSTEKLYDVLDNIFGVAVFGAALLVMLEFVYIFINYFLLG